MVARSKEYVWHAKCFALQEDAVRILLAEVHNLGEGRISCCFEGTLEFLFELWVPYIKFWLAKFLGDLVNINHRDFGGFNLWVRPLGLGLTLSWSRSL